MVDFRDFQLLFCVFFCSLIFDADSDLGIPSVIFRLETVCSPSDLCKWYVQSDCDVAQKGLIATQLGGLLGLELSHSLQGCPTFWLSLIHI